MKKIRSPYDTGIKWSKTPLKHEEKLKNDNYRAYLESLDKLFAICSYRYPIGSSDCREAICYNKDCNSGLHLKCKCEVKLTQKEADFLCNQRGPPVMFLGEVDVKLTQKWKRTEERVKKETQKYSKKVKYVENSNK